ncbi:MAG: hypothetical protein D6754_13915, partial [Alphaproteobacteria bacterium]
MTPENYWEEMQALYGRMGYTLSVDSQEKVGDTLVLNGFGYTAEFAQKVGDETVTTTARASVDRVEIAPIDNPDYDLQMTMSETVSIEVGVSPGGKAEPVAIPFDIHIPGNRLLVGKDGERTVFDGSADAIDMTLTRFPAEPGGPKVDGKIALEMKDIAYSGNYALGEDADYDVKGTAASISFGIHFKEKDQVFTVAVNYSDTAFDALGPFVNFTDAASMFAAGATILNMSAASSSAHIEIKDNRENLLITSTGGEGKLKVYMGRGQVDYSFEGNDSVYNISGNALPLPPVKAELKRVGMRFAMPLIPMEEPGELAYELHLEGVTVSEEVWGMIDPGGALPRDPADIILVVESKSKALVDLTNPEAMAQAAMMGPPFEFQDLRIKEVTLRLAGAEIHAEGSAVINNDGPMPVPVGGVDVEINGVLGVIEKLQQIGLIPP